MAKHAAFVPSTHQSPSQVASVFVLFDAEIGPVHVPVSACVPVKYAVFYVPGLQRYTLSVCMGNEWVGFHCGERSGEVIRFVRESDAVRLADARNAAWRARSVKDQQRKLMSAHQDV